MVRFLPKSQTQNKLFLVPGTSPKTQPALFMPFSAAFTVHVLYLSGGRPVGPEQSVATSGLKLVSGELQLTFSHLWPAVDQVTMHRLHM